MERRELNRILCVEDEDDIREVATLALEAVGGFTVLACASGKEALERAPGFAPDLIVLDVMMPGMDGPATLKAIRADPRLARTPVLFMTAKVQAHETAQLKALGVMGIVAKPFDAMTLGDTIRGIWNEQYK